MSDSKKRKRETTDMPPEYVKGPGKKGELHPHWRKSFPDDEEDADGRGKVEQGLPGHGVWRRVPGFWMILASEDGNVMTMGGSKVRKLTVGGKGYAVVGCNYYMQQVHLLVCRAFHGRPLPHQTSADHIGGKELPFAERRSNNRADNLRWATQKQQKANQKKDRKPQSNGEPCVLWEVQGRAGGHMQSVAYMMPISDDVMEFVSAFDAARVLGLNHAQLSNVLNGKMKTVADVSGRRFTGRWESDDVNLPDEQWTQHSKNLRFSNYGRLQSILRNGRYGTKRFPGCTDEDLYLTVQIGNRTNCVHTLVGNFFFIGPRPRDWEVWDHKDRNKRNNHVGNLRPVSRSENGVNCAGQRDFYVWPTGKPEERIVCRNQNEVARRYNFYQGTLNAVLHKRPNKDGSIHKTVRGYCAAFCDEVE